MKPISLEDYELLVTNAAKIQAKKLFPKNTEAQRGYIAGFLNAHLIHLTDAEPCSTNTTKS